MNKKELPRNTRQPLTKNLFSMKKIYCEIRLVFIYRKSSVFFQIKKTSRQYADPPILIKKFLPVFPISRQRLIEASYGIVNINIFRKKASHFLFFSRQQKKGCRKRTSHNAREILKVKLAREILHIFFDKASPYCIICCIRKGTTYSQSPSKAMKTIALANVI